MIAADPRGPVGVALADHDSYRPLAWSVTVAHTERYVLDESIRADFDRFADLGWRDWGIGSRSRDDRFWIVGTGSDLDPGSTHLYDRQEDTITRIAEVRPALHGAALSRMHAVTIAARDGVSLISYLTLPHAVDLTEGEVPKVRVPVPLVLQVHGGPAARDGFGFDPTHQWLADRGYAVLSVNFRGSAGFTKSFLAADDGEWGARMSDELDDAVA